MALFGNIPDLARVLSADARFAPAFEYLARFARSSLEFDRIRNMQDGKVEKIELAEGSFALDQVYATRDRGDCVFESHRKYIDVQCILEGEEGIDVAHIAGLEVEQPYRDTVDVALYRDPGPASSLRLKAGQAAVFFPEDGHMPGQHFGEARTVRKTVVKVPVGP